MMNIMNIEVTAPQELALAREDDFVFSTDFMAIANIALEKGDDPDAGIARFKAANIIEKSVSSKKLALCIEALLWTKTIKETQRTLETCREVYEMLYGSTSNARLISISSDTGHDWWNDNALDIAV